MFLTVAVMGCQTLNREQEASEISRNSTLSAKQQELLGQARNALAGGDVTEARRLTQQVLAKEDNAEQAQQVMAQILDQEIARQKEMIETTALEEYTPDEKDDLVKTWIERSKSYLSFKQYDEALFAAEKVFLYDPANAQASKLIDEIKKRAYDEGKGDSLILKQMYQTEIHGRIRRYHHQAKQHIKKGQWGAARITVEKILLLAPDDSEALKLYQQIKDHKKTQAQ